MPEHIRLLLIKELSPGMYNEARTAIIGILNEPEQTGRMIANITSQINIALPRVFPVLSEAILRGLRAAEAKGRIFRDYIFVQFLDSAPKTLLNLEIPRSLSKVFYPHGNTALRMRLYLRILTVLLISTLLWLTAPIIARAIKTEPTLTAQRITVSERPSLSATATPTVDVTPGTTPPPQQTPQAANGGPDTTRTPQSTSAPGPGSTRNDQHPQSTPPPSLPTDASPTPSPAQQPTATPSPTREDASGWGLDMAPVCPRVKVIADNLAAFTLSNNLSQSLRAEITGGKVLQPPRYVWSLQVNGSSASSNQGVIIAGQGSSSVDILWKVNTKEASKVTAKVTVTGYNVTCATEASSSIQIIKEIIAAEREGDCGCGSCGSLQCCPNPGSCVSCGICGQVCCNGGP